MFVEEYQEVWHQILWAGCIVPCSFSKILAAEEPALIIRMRVRSPKMYWQANNEDKRGMWTKSQVDSYMCKIREIFEDNEATAQANRCKSVFKRFIQGTRNSLGKSSDPPSSIFYDSVVSVIMVWKGSWCQTSQTAGEQRIWLPFILFPRIEGKHNHTPDTGVCGCWGVCADEANRLNLVWLEQREAAQVFEGERNVEGRSLLEITVISGQSCDVTS